jgi:hypothetical protein
MAMLPAVTVAVGNATALSVRPRLPAEASPCSFVLAEQVYWLGLAGRRTALTRIAGRSWSRLSVSIVAYAAAQS